MNTVRLTQARKLFTHEGVPAHTVRHNIRSWVRMVRLLGPNWRGLAR